eukprot:1724632-Rhodomonas_salina.1
MKASICEHIQTGEDVYARIVGGQGSVSTTGQGRMCKPHHHARPGSAGDQRSVSTAGEGHSARSVGEHRYVNRAD